MGVMVGSMRTSVDGKTGSRLYDPFVNFGQYAQSMHFPRHPFEGRFGGVRPLLKP
jgi:hypothetical protein